AVYGAAVATATRALCGDASAVIAPLTARMTALAGQQRFEEAALVRDRVAALDAAARRHRLVEALRAAGRVRLRRGEVTWTIEHARLVDVTIHGEVGRALPVTPPDPAEPGRPLGRAQIDEAVCLAKFC